MKKFAPKKFISMLLSATLLTASLGSVAINAEEISEEPVFYLIEETETELDDGTIVIDKLYSDSPNIGIEQLSTASASGTNVFKHEKTFVGQDSKIICLSLQASFSWDQDTHSATIDTNSIETNYISYVSTNKFIKDKLSYGSNMGSEDIFGAGHVYAFARYYVEIANRYQYHKVYEVYLDVNCLGTPSRNDNSSGGTLAVSEKGETI